MSHLESCQLCGHPVKLHTATGRFCDYRRGVSLPIPADFAMPTCVECGETYLSEAEHEALAEAQRPAFLEWQKEQIAKLVEAIKAGAKQKIRIKDIETAAGVTGTYVSHLLAGRKEVSAPLLKLLEAFALHPSEFERQLQGVRWERFQTRPMVSILSTFQKGVAAAFRFTGPTITWTVTKNYVRSPLEAVAQAFPFTVSTKTGVTPPPESSLKVA